jgi:long-subunit fatty acid transport protein
MGLRAGQPGARRRLYYAMPNGPRVSCAVALGLLLSAGTHAHAQIGLSLNRAGSGARAAGMGDAFIAVSDDGTAASWNPAGLAQLRQPEFSLVYVVSNHDLGLSGVRAPDESVAYSGSSFGYNNNSIDFASAAVPFSVAKKPVTLQLGWHRLYQLSADFTGAIERVPVNPAGPTTLVLRADQTDGDIDLYSVAGAIKLTSRLAVGVSLDFWRGDWIDRRSLIEEATEGSAGAYFTTSQAIEMRGQNLSGGILLTYPDWNIGLVYHAPFWSSFHVKGQAMTTGRPAASFETTSPRFHLPRSMGAGLARRFGPRWTASAALTHDQWTDAVLDQVPGVEGPRSFFDNAPPSLSTTRDTLSLNVGVEHLVLREGSVVPLRIGFGWEPQGGTDAFTRDPVDYLLVSAGAGYNTNRFKFDAAVQYRHGSFLVSDTYSVATALDAPGRDAIARAETGEWRIKVSAIYRLADTDALKGALRRIFG